MASFVKNSCFVYVIGRPAEPLPFVVGSFFHLGTLLLIAQAQCLSVGRSWRASRMAICFQKLVDFVRSVSIFAMVSQGASQERRLYIVLLAYGQHVAQKEFVRPPWVVFFRL